VSSCHHLAALVVAPVVAFGPLGARAQELVPVVEPGKPMRLELVSTQPAAAATLAPCTISTPVDRRTTLSSVCMTCHDGSRTGAADARKGHKFGVDYESARSRPGSGLRLDPESFGSLSVVILQAGQVGCMSCHSPTSTLPFHVAAPTGGPVAERLCVACHVH
jgi:hypothetical protein